MQQGNWLKASIFRKIAQGFLTLFSFTPHCLSAPLLCFIWWVNLSKESKSHYPWQWTSSARTDTHSLARHAQSLESSFYIFSVLFCWFSYTFQPRIGQLYQLQVNYTAAIISTDNRHPHLKYSRAKRRSVQLQASTDISLFWYYIFKTQTMRTSCTCRYKLSLPLSSPPLWVSLVLSTPASLCFLKGCHDNLAGQLFPALLSDPRRAEQLRLWNVSRGHWEQSGRAGAEHPGGDIWAKTGGTDNWQFTASEMSGLFWAHRKHVKRNNMNERD